MTARVLLDTHALLWWVTNDAALPERARATIADPKTTALVSAVTLWEVAVKRSIGKLEAPDDLPERVAADGFTWLAVTPEHAWHVSELPLHHRDPFDRLLVAQARVEGVAVVTRDARFAAYGVGVTWA